MKKIRAHVIISGMVQGVCFRYETQARAKEMGLTGWVMNRRDGAVEAVFEGEKDDVESIVKWCHTGPNGAIVKDVDIEWQDYAGGFDEFGIKFSGY